MKVFHLMHPVHCKLALKYWHWQVVFSTGTNKLYQVSKYLHWYAALIIISNTNSKQTNPCATGPRNDTKFTVSLNASLWSLPLAAGFNFVSLNPPSVLTVLPPNVNNGKINTKPPAIKPQYYNHYEREKAFVQIYEFLARQQQQKTSKHK